MSVIDCKSSSLQGELVSDVTERRKKRTKRSDWADGVKVANTINIEGSRESGTGPGSEDAEIRSY